MLAEAPVALMVVDGAKLGSHPIVMDDVSLQVQLQSASFFPKSVKERFDERLVGRCGQKHSPSAYSFHGAGHDLTLAL